MGRLSTGSSGGRSSGPMAGTPGAGTMAGSTSTSHARTLRRYRKPMQGARSVRPRCRMLLCHRLLF